VFKQSPTLRVVAMLCTPLITCCVHAADDELLVDPTMPLSIAIVPEAVTDRGFDLLGGFETYELNSVLIRSADRVAVINGQRVRAGDRVGTARVAAIESDHVTLNVNGKIERLELYGSSIKTLSKVTSDDE
jgi:hypothetical protein